MRAPDVYHEKNGADVQMKYHAQYDHEVACWGVVNSNKLFVFTTDSKSKAIELVDCLNNNIKDW